jgi:hypothetical protein
VVTELGVAEASLEDPLEPDEVLSSLALLEPDELLPSLELLEPPVLVVEVLEPDEVLSLLELVEPLPVLVEEPLEPDDLPSPPEAPVVAAELDPFALELEALVRSTVATVAVELFCLLSAGS